jgi:hypothetical protein
MRWGCTLQEDFFLFVKVNSLRQASDLGFPSGSGQHLAREAAILKSQYLGRPY